MAFRDDVSEISASQSSTDDGEYSSVDMVEAVYVDYDGNVTQVTDGRPPEGYGHATPAAPAGRRPCHHQQLRIQKAARTLLMFIRVYLLWHNVRRLRAREDFSESNVRYIHHSETEAESAIHSSTLNAEWQEV